MAEAVAFQRMVMPTPYFSNLFETKGLDIIDPLLELNDQCFGRLDQVLFYRTEINLVDYKPEYY